MPPKAPQQLDSDVVNLAKAIRQTESGGNFQARGKSGEYGGYQYTQPTWETYSKKHGVNVPLEQATPEQQNEVTYKQIKEWKDQGYNPGQIASMWNSGKPDAYLDTNYKGVNKHGVAYDVPKYAESVAKAYHSIKSGGSVGIDPQNPSSIGTQYKPPEDDKTLGKNLQERVGQFSGAVNKTLSGEINPLSGLIQTAGAVAGGIGDVVSSAFELIPGVKKLEELIGVGVGKLAETDAGKAVASSIQEFSEKHPELADNIGATFNIVTAIPVLKGLGVAKEAFKDAASVTLRNLAEKGAEKDLAGILSRTKTGVQFMQKNPEAIKTMVEKRLLPDIADGRLSTIDARNMATSQIKDLNTKVQSLLDQPQYLKTTGGGGEIVANTTKKFPNSKFGYDDIVNNGRELTPQNNLLWDKFEAGKATMSDINKLRSDLDSAVETVYTKMNQPPIKKEMGAALAGSMRDFVKSSVKETVPLFDQMTANFRIKDALKILEHKPIKSGGGLVRDIGMAGGELAGGTVGVPIAGALTARHATGLIQRSLGKYSVRSMRGGVLSRTTTGASRQSLKNVNKGLLKAGTGSALIEKNR